MSTEPLTSIFSEIETEAILKAVERRIAVQAMTDVELSDAVITEVWAQLAFCGENEVLLDEMIERFDKRCGIVRGEDGEVVS